MSEGPVQWMAHSTRGLIGKFSKGTIYLDVGKLQKPQGTGKYSGTNNHGKLLPGPRLKGQVVGAVGRTEESYR